MTTAEELWGLSRADLRERMRRGFPVDAAHVADLAFRGTSLGMPAFVDRLAWKTFRKCFVRDERGVRGWNVRLEQTGLRGASVPMRKDGKTLAFGHFRVVRGDASMFGLADALLLDYGQGGNPRLDPTSLVRDPVVSVNEGDSSLLLGCTYLQAGPFRIVSPSFFTLEREGAVDDVARPRGAA